MLEATCPFCYLRLYAENQAELAELVCPGCGKHAGHRALDIKDNRPAENAAPSPDQPLAPRDLLDATARLQALLQSQTAAGDASNPYASPPQLAEFGAADIAMPAGGFHDLADLSTRFVGGLIDWGLYLIAGCVGLLAAYGVAQWQSIPFEATAETPVLLLALCAPIVPLAIAQWVLISTTAQSFGKRAMNMRIVRHSDGAPIGFVRGVLLRSIVSRVLMRLMCRLGSLIDVLVIFTPDRRCLHDYIAGTVVVRVREEQAREPQ